MLAVSLVGISTIVPRRCVCPFPETHRTSASSRSPPLARFPLVLSIFLPDVDLLHVHVPHVPFPQMSIPPAAIPPLHRYFPCIDLPPASIFPRSFSTSVSTSQSHSHRLPSPSPTSIPHPLRVGSRVWGLATAASDFIVLSGPQNAALSWNILIRPPMPLTGNVPFASSTSKIRWCSNVVCDTVVGCTLSISGIWRQVTFPIPVPGVEWMVREIKVRCPHHIPGAAGALGDNDDDADGAGADEGLAGVVVGGALDDQPEPAAVPCEAVVTVGTLEAHLAGECPAQRARCPQCGRAVARAERAAHLAERCPGRRVACPKCTQLVAARELMQSETGARHLRQECPAGCGPAARDIVPRSPTLIPDVNALTHLHASLCVSLKLCVI
ncbi:hypothetical protein PAPYR_10588 [Paratrimastix pyriformis]|uniref:TRAF-type domain-containing protein n=1 Tax=Paratrimastix pyriformis TaxID=342808 RepID=A0ABQ8U5K8_9EUKA|nr:hypothetical protein PAPYR_10588 [Paratrimastix pyriformis]